MPICLPDWAKKKTYWMSSWFHIEYNKPTQLARVHVHVESTLTFQRGFNVGDQCGRSTLNPRVFMLDYTWNAHVESPWIQRGSCTCGFPVDYTWIPRWLHVDSPWTWHSWNQRGIHECGFPVDYTWIPRELDVRGITVDSPRVNSPLITRGFPVTAWSSTRAFCVRGITVDSTWILQV